MVIKLHSQYAAEHCGKERKINCVYMYVHESEWGKKKKIKQNNSKLVRQKTVQYLNATLLQKGLLSFQIIFDNTSRHLWCQGKVNAN